MPDITIAPGDIPTAAQWNSYMLHTGAGFNAWTPVVTQPGAVSVTVAQASYHRTGRLIQATCALAVTGTGTASNAVTITLPVAAANSTNSTFIGLGKLFDASSTFDYLAFINLNSTTTCRMQSVAAGSATYLGGTGSFTAALASGDVICLKLEYEAATG